MKILHFTNFYPQLHSTLGGAEQAAKRTIELLQKNKFKNIVITTTFADKTKIKNYPYQIKSIKIIQDYFKSKTIKQYFFALKILFFPLDIVVYWQTKKILKKLKPDIIYLHHFDELSFAVVIAAKKLKIPVVLAVYDYWYFCPKETLTINENKLCENFQGGNCINCYPLGRLKFLKFLFYFRKPLFNYFLNLIDKFVVLSKDSKNLLVDYGINSQKINIIPLYYEIKDVPQLKPQPYTLLFAGWIQFRKGLHIIIAALPNILQKFPHIKLKILAMKADENYKNLLMAKIKNLNLQNNIFWEEGNFTNEKILKEILNNQIVVVAEQWRNMSPVIIIESMFLKKIIVASNLGGIPELIKDKKTGLLAHYNSPEDFANKIIWALENLKIAEQFGYNAYNEAVNKFSKQNILQKYKQLFVR